MRVKESERERERGRKRERKRINESEREGNFEWKHHRTFARAVQIKCARDKTKKNVHFFLTREQSDFDNGFSCHNFQ